MSKSSLPTYDQLPIDPKYPAKTAWGLWGTGDNLGTLNLLTAERVAEVYIHIKEDQVFLIEYLSRNVSLGQSMHQTRQGISAQLGIGEA